MPTATWLPIASIRVGPRQRQDLGDLDALAASLAEVGQLQPVAVSPDGLLVAGRRRLEAAKKLGWESIAVHVIEGLDDALARLRAERDEQLRFDDRPLPRFDDPPAAPAQGH